MLLRYAGAALALCLALACSSGAQPTASAAAIPGATAGAGGPSAGNPPAAMPGASGYLHTRGTDIVDANGAVVRITGVNWFGLETANFAPHGLWTRSMSDMLDGVKDLGYNALRIPFSNQLFDPGSVPNSIDYAKNPDLVGLDGLHILDRLVAAAKARGLRVILDRHRPDASGQSELWYTSTTSEERWISDWKMLAERYRGDPTVIGCDLHNEPHGAATWGDGNPATDWRLAAERAGNAILSVNPDLLIFVEGVEKAGGVTSWWGGNLRMVATAPVVLSVPDRLVYSTHDYPSSVFPQTWFSDPTYPKNLPGVWDASWGFIVENGIAPVWVGEFGTRDVSPSDQEWFKAVAKYIGEHGLSFTFWSLNPDSGDTGGLLQDDWSTVNEDKQSMLKPLLAPTL
jgi:endoglucanase